MQKNTNELRKEYKELDKKLTEFRLAWNKKAHKDLRDTYKGKHIGKQAPFPDWLEPATKRWRQLRVILDITD